MAKRLLLLNGSRAQVDRLRSCLSVAGYDVIRLSGDYLTEDRLRECAIDLSLILIEDQKTLAALAKSLRQIRGPAPPWIAINTGAPDLGFGALKAGAQDCIPLQAPPRFLMARIQNLLSRPLTEDTIVLPAGFQEAAPVFAHPARLCLWTNTVSDPSADWVADLAQCAAIRVVQTWADTAIGDLSVFGQRYLERPTSPPDNHGSTAFVMFTHDIASIHVSAALQDGARDIIPISAPDKERAFRLKRALFAVAQSEAV